MRLSSIFRPIYIPLFLPAPVKHVLHILPHEGSIALWDGLDATGAKNKTTICRAQSATDVENKQHAETNTAVEKFCVELLQQNKQKWGTVQTLSGNAIIS